MGSRGRGGHGSQKLTHSRGVLRVDDRLNVGDGNPRQVLVLRLQRNRAAKRSGNGVVVLVAIEVIAVPE